MSLLNDLMNTDHHITLEEAVELTSRYRNEMPGILRPEYADDNVLPLSETFEKSIFIDLGSQNECVAIRSYFGMDENHKVRLIFVGVNENNEDMLNSMFEHGHRCPPICPPSGPLNPQP